LTDGQTDGRTEPRKKLSTTWSRNINAPIADVAYNAVTRRVYLHCEVGVSGFDIA